MAEKNGNEIEVNGLNGTPNGHESVTIPMAKLIEIKVTDYMKKCLDKVAAAEGFMDYELNMNHGSAVGDGFVGILFKVTIQENNDSDKKLSVVLKCPPENQARRSDFGAMDLFKREVLAYNEVLPAFVKFQEDRRMKESDCFTQFPKCYFAEYNEEIDDAVIIMEDLKENGYKMWDKFEPMNFEHTKLVVASLGRLHAISFAMKAQKLDCFEKFTSLNDFTSEKFADSNFFAIMTGTIDRAAETLDENDVKTRNRVLSLKSDFSGVMKELVDPKRAEPYAVVTHGDCWLNNFMFQYKRNFPVKIVLLDWQITRYCSPVLDLVYFIFVSTDGPTRAKHYDELLNIYHRSLKELLDHLGGDTMSQFPFTALLRQLKQFGKFGVIMACMILPMLSTRNSDLPDMDFIAESINKDDPVLKEEMMKAYLMNSDGFKPRMRAVLLDAMRYGYL